MEKEAVLPEAAQVPQAHRGGVQVADEKEGGHAVEGGRRVFRCLPMYVPHFQPHLLASLFDSFEVRGMTRVRGRRREPPAPRRGRPDQRGWQFAAPGVAARDLHQPLASHRQRG